ncbi:hypothetical protein OEZ85_005549 [Tetradesmus obliquus]|uniref:Uncharacterized protein n=1 Tax=Tetradesmus obliquus TaxID=3088 RepID=A0ABY8UGR1_TETOB|nr:hypothetical protein OEZ85_005549 [Tetradesmus obliquus]
MGYLGCGTSINKVAWTVFAVLLALAAVMLGIGLGKTVPCTRTLTACKRANPGQERDACSLPPAAKSTGGQPYGAMTGMVQMQQGYPTAAPAAGTLGQQQQQGYSPYGGAAAAPGYSGYSQQPGQPGWPQQGMQSGVPVTRY